MTYGGWPFLMRSKGWEITGARMSGAEDGPARLRARERRRLNKTDDDSLPPSRQRRPSDRCYARLRGSCVALLVALILYAAVGVRYVPVSQAIGFRLILAGLLAFNAIWWLTADRRFARHIRSPRRSAALRATAALFSFAVNVPIIYMFVGGRAPGVLASAPSWYAASVTLWHICLVALLPILSLLRSIGVGALALVRRLRRGTRKEETDVDTGRRAVLHTAVASVPMILLGGATVAARAQEGNLLVRKLSLPAPWLPDRLDGLTITHLSDLHVGRHYRPFMLPRLVDAVNKLDSDIIVVTGDVVDVSNEMLPPAVAAFEQMQHRYGMYHCIGNHDEIDDRAGFVAYMRQNLSLLINERRALDIGGERLTIAGLDFSRGDEPSGRRAGDLVNTMTMCHGYDPHRDGPMIALTHHPHAFDRLSQHDVPLTLSGHTHGGQLMLAAPGRRPEWGAGSLLFHYIRGFYRKGPATLFVNSGVGNWFPLRFHAPAEIVQIRLVC